MKSYADLRFGLLGGRLGHSFSPQIHSCLADYEYKLYPMPVGEVAAWVKNNGLDGFNVTIPYKETVLPLCDAVSARARKIGAVNTVRRMPDGKLYGDNTDYYGFEYLTSKLGIRLFGKKALVLGSGGSSKTVCAVLSDLGAKPVVISRSGENNYGNLSLHADASLIVNTTPVGMYPGNGVSPIDISDFHLLEGVIDIIYNPARTELLLRAEKAGIPCINGLPMLVAQAKAAFEVFTSDMADDAIIDTVTRRVEAQTKNIILIGMPGCGKTVCGRLVAEKTGRAFTDTDMLVSSMFGKTPSDIIATEGEAEFRKKETEALKKACIESGGVIATGGGVVTVPDNYGIMRQNGVIIFLERDIKALDLKGRPLSVDIPALYKKRLPLYRSFSDVSASGDGTPEEAADKILQAWEKI